MLCRKTSFYKYNNLSSREIPSQTNLNPAVNQVMRLLYMDMSSTTKVVLLFESNENEFLAVR